MNAYQNFSDQELMAFVSEDDDLAFAEIYHRYKGILYLHAYRILGNEEESKDVLQELFTTLWSKRSTIVLKGSLSSYLYGACRNRIFDMISHKKVELKYLNSLASFVEEGECVTDHLLREKQLTELIEKEIELLPTKMRQVFELSRKQNLSYTEIANELQISDKTVKKQVTNALHILRTKLDIAFIISFILKYI